MVNQRDPHPGKGNEPEHAHGGNKPQDPNQPAPKVPEESQKSQIAQYFKSQGRQPDDEIFNIGGLKLRLKDLD